MSSPVIKAVFGPGGELARRLDRYKPRDGQIRMATCVDEILDKPGVLLVEAGTGVGKTFAYLVPLLARELRVLVSTSTKALQDQLFTKDLPFVFALLHQKPDFMVLKGFGNYLCLHKYESLCEECGYKSGQTEIKGMEEARGDPQKRALCRRVEKLIKHEQERFKRGEPIGTFCDLSLSFSADERKDLTCSSEECQSCFKRNCEHAALDCYPRLARQQAARARVVVVNHQLLFCSLAIENLTEPCHIPGLLPHPQVIVLDEAHDLPEQGRKFMARHAGEETIKAIERGLTQLLDSGTLEVSREVALAPCRQCLTAYTALASYLYDRHDRHDRHDRDRKNHDAREDCQISFMQAFFSDYRASPAAKTWQSCHKRDGRFLELFDKLMTALQNLNNQLTDFYERDANAIDGLLKQAEQHIEVLEDLCKLARRLEREDGCFFLPENSQGAAPAAPVRPELGLVSFTRKQCTFTLQPLEIDHAFREFAANCALYGMPLVLTSATLTAGGGSFAKIRRDLGLVTSREQMAGFQAAGLQRTGSQKTGSQRAGSQAAGPQRTALKAAGSQRAGAQADAFTVRECLVASPFDYPRHALRWILPDPPVAADPVTRKDYLWNPREIVDQVLPLLELLPGGAMFLCTTTNAVREFGVQLRNRLKDRRVLCQYEKYSNNDLINLFRHDQRAVLVGSRSFWTGVDVPGPSLSLLVIDRQPFSVPDDPLFKARNDWCEFCGEKPFWVLTVPEAAILLRQGVGRLIRAEEDRGVVVLCDHRIRTKKSYGPYLLKGLPPMGEAQDIAEVLAFMKDMKGMQDMKGML